MKKNDRRINVCGKYFYVKTRNSRIYLTNNLKEIIETHPHIIMYLVMLRIEPEVKSFLKTNSSWIKRASKSKIRSLMETILMSNKPSIYLKRLKDICVIESILPELYKCCVVDQNKEYHKYNVFEHCIYTADNVDKDLLLRWAALLHDVGKHETMKIREGRQTFYKHDIAGAITARKILNRFGYKKRFTERVSKLVRFHMYYYKEEWSDKAIRKFIDNMGINNKNIHKLEDLPVFKLRAADRIGGGMKHTAVTEIQKKFEDRIKEVYFNS